MPTFDWNNKTVHILNFALWPWAFCTTTTCTQAVCVRLEGRDVGECIACWKVCTLCPQHMYTSDAVVLPQMLLQAVIWPSFYGDTDALGFASLRISANKQRSTSPYKVAVYICKHTKWQQSDESQPQVDLHNDAVEARSLWWYWHWNFTCWAIHAGGSLVSSEQRPLGRNILLLSVYQQLCITQQLKFQC